MQEQPGGPVVRELGHSTIGADLPIKVGLQCVWRNWYFIQTVLLDQRTGRTSLSFIFLLNGLELAIRDLQQPSDRHEAPSNRQGNGGLGLVLDIVLDLCPCMLENRADLNLSPVSSEAGIFRQVRPCIVERYDIVNALIS